MEDKIYLDYAASTPVDRRVVEVMLPFFSEKYGNAGSLHGLGQESIKAIDEAREKIANSIGANFREIIFTGSATEANNLCLRGITDNYLLNNDDKPRIIVSEIEHDAVLATAKALEKRGVEVIYAPVNDEGVVDVQSIKDNLNKRTVLVSIMYVNNETGVIQPIPEIKDVIEEFKDSNQSSPYPFFHTDAVQAFQFLNCDVSDLGIDLATFSAHKLYGPKGIGALYIKKDYFNSGDEYIEPIITGGSQEFGLRGGTENVPYIAGFGKAVELIDKDKEKQTERIESFSSLFLKNIKEALPETKINGTEKRTPNILNLSLPNLSNEDLLIKLDMEGVCVSSGAACSARSTKKSHVLQAMGVSSDSIDSSLRFSFGRPTTEEEITKAVEILKNIY